MTYLRGMAFDAVSGQKSFCLITPSTFRGTTVMDPDLKDHIVFLRTESEIPKHATPDKIYILETKNLPHRVFISLVALGHA